MNMYIFVIVIDYIIKVLKGVWIYGMLLHVGM